MSGRIVQEHSLEGVVIGIMIGLIGGFTAAILALPYGYVEALLAYSLAGSLFSLIPGLIAEINSYDH
jgi:uncharacterized membrane protein YeaQ/YmgE (transglycosylase-associated protein family)